MPRKNAGRWIHPGFQGQLIRVHVDDRATRRTGVHARPRNSWRNAVDQTRIKGVGMM